MNPHLAHPVSENWKFITTKSFKIRTGLSFVLLVLFVETESRVYAKLKSSPYHCTSANSTSRETPLQTHGLNSFPLCGGSMQVLQPAGKPNQTKTKQEMHGKDENERQPNFIVTAAGLSLLESCPDHFTLAIFKHSKILGKNVF